MLVTNPNVAFVLLLIGVYGLIFEFLNPGAVAPGLRHQSSLVAFYALAFEARPQNIDGEMMQERR